MALKVSRKMLRTILIFKMICLLAFTNSFSIPGKKSWNFEFISIVTNSSDESRVKFDVKLKRISRGVYGLDGTLLVNDDVKEGDNTMIEASVYRSVTGSSEYKPTPFVMKRQHVYQFLNTFYKDILMNSLAECSDLPAFKDTFQPPLEKKTYRLNNCKISNDGLPPVMSEGFYRITVIGSGKVDYAIEGIVKVESTV